MGVFDGIKGRFGRKKNQDTLEALKKKIDELEDIANTLLEEGKNSKDIKRQEEIIEGIKRIGKEIEELQSQVEGKLQQEVDSEYQKEYETVVKRCEASEESLYNLYNLLNEGLKKMDTLNGATHEAEIAHKRAVKFIEEHNRMPKNKSTTESSFEVNREKEVGRMFRTPINSFEKTKNDPLWEEFKGNLLSSTTDSNMVQMLEDKIFMQEIKRIFVELQEKGKTLDISNILYEGKQIVIPNIMTSSNEEIYYMTWKLSVGKDENVCVVEEKRDNNKELKQIKTKNIGANGKDIDLEVMELTKEYKKMPQGPKKTMRQIVITKKYKIPNIYSKCASEEIKKKYEELKNRGIEILDKDENGVYEFIIDEKCFEDSSLIKYKLYVNEDRSITINEEQNNGLSTTNTHRQIDADGIENSLRVTETLRNGRPIRGVNIAKVKKVYTRDSKSKKAILETTIFGTRDGMEGILEESNKKVSVGEKRILLPGELAKVWAQNREIAKKKIGSKDAFKRILTPEQLQEIEQMK